MQICPKDMSPSQVREHAYELWRSCGQNIAETVKALSAEGFVFTRQTIAAWRDKYAWEERAARAEAAAEQALDVTEAEMISMASKQLRRYDRYFDSLPDDKADNMAVFAFNGLMKTYHDIRYKKAPGAAQPAAPTAGREIKTAQDAIEALSDAIEAHLNLVLANPELMDLKKSKEVRESMKLLDELKARYQSETHARRRGLSEDAAEEIRRKILGLAS